ncbi:hypothetical protein BH11CYA1_BH11CYA1_11840 [soil metagenome]
MRQLNLPIIAKAGTTCIVLTTIFSASVFQAACAQDTGSSSLQGASRSTPSQIYMTFHEKMLAANSVDDLCPLFTATRVAQIRSDEKTLPPAQVKAMFQFMQKVSPRKVRILGEAINNDSCTLTLDAPGYKDPIFGEMMTAADSKEIAANSSVGSSIETSVKATAKKGTVGKISLLREDGQWKIEKESWQSGD